MTGMTEDEYRNMMIDGGRSVEGNRFVGEDGDAQAHHQPQGAAASRRRPDRWRASPPPSTPATCRPSARRSTSARPRALLEAACSQGYEFSKQWMKDNKPDVIFLVYNDHATAFSLEMIPTFAIGTAARVQAGRRRLGPAPGAQGHRPPGAGRAHRAVA